MARMLLAGYALQNELSTQESHFLTAGFLVEVSFSQALFMICPADFDFHLSLTSDFRIFLLSLIPHSTTPHLYHHHEAINCP
jgi:hypothetical protein